MLVTERRNLWTNPNGMRPATRTIVVHHAAATYAPGTAAEKIYAYHSQKWPDYHAAAYHEILDRFPDGTIRCSIMNPPGIIGAGVFGRNDDTFHICAATNFLGIPADDWIDAIAQRCAEASKRYPAAVVRGHKEIAIPGHQTACPGALWDRWKPDLLRRISAALATPSAPVAPDHPFARWGTIGRPDGAAQGYAIPRAWLMNQALGACVAAETYSASGEYSIAEFEHGLIAYYKRRNAAIVELF